MLRCHQSRLKSVVVAPFGAVAFAVLLAACSADIRRLEQPTYAIGEKPPLPSEPVGRRSLGNDEAVGAPLPARSAANDRVTSIPEAAPSVNPSHPIDTPRKAKVAAGAPAAAPQSAPIVAGATIDVQPGDTLYAISKRHHVSIAALMELNQLKSAALKPGQKIVLPANARRPIAKTAATAPAGAVGQAPATAPAATPAPVAVAPPAAPTDWDGSYVVKAGDSLYGIARAHKVNVAELQRVNGITDALKMRPGMTLKVPAGSVGATHAAAPAAPPVASSEPVARPAPQHAPSGGIKLLNPPTEGSPAAKESAAIPPAKVAAIGPVAVPAGASPKFRWPAKGAMLAGFGKRPDGAHNYGINISVPAGTEISAAEAGTVAYAGSEIKAYGNLVLIRHEGGWVTAYAHADQILVKRGDTVTRGQVIAKAGATGAVDQPQVHFELRQGAKPVDPTPHMEK